MKTTTVKLFVVSLMLTCILETVNAGKIGFKTGKKQKQTTPKKTKEEAENEKKLGEAIKHIKVLCENPTIKSEIKAIGEIDNPIRVGPKKLIGFLETIKKHFKIDHTKSQQIESELNQALKMTKDEDLKEYISHAAGFYRSLHTLEGMTEQKARDMNIGWQNNIIEQCSTIHAYCEDKGMRHVFF